MPVNVLIGSRLVFGQFPDMRTARPFWRVRARLVPLCPAAYGLFSTIFCGRPLGLRVVPSKPDSIRAALDGYVSRASGF